MSTENLSEQERASDSLARVLAFTRDSDRAKYARRSITGLDLSPVVVYQPEMQKGDITFRESTAETEDSCRHLHGRLLSR